MPTYQEIVDGALRQLGVLGAGSSATAEETSDAVDALIDWLDQQSMHGLMQAERSVRKHTFTEGKLNYSVGATGDRDIGLDLPAELHELLYRRTFDTDGRPLDQVSYSALTRYRDSDATEPYLFVIEKSEPAMLRLDAKPIVGDELTVVGGTWMTPARAEITDYTAPTNFSRGYRRALVLNLALELADAYGVVPTKNLTRRAGDAMETLRATNIEPFTVEFDRALLANPPRAFR